MATFLVFRLTIRADYTRIRLMSRTSPKFIWQQAGWPHLSFDASAAHGALMLAAREQGVVEGKASAVGIGPSAEFLSEVLIDEVIATAAIEGERLPPASVRSSIARRHGLVESSSQTGQVDGLVDVIRDASEGYLLPLDQDRLCRWQSALFPGGTSGIRRIAVGRYRDHPDAMQIVSGQHGREVVHYEAPPSAAVPKEMDAFLAWFARTAPATALVSGPGTRELELDGVARASIAHLWFESIHPFEDGNGRLGRAVVDQAIAQYLGGPTRLVSLSSQFLRNRRGYYDALNQSQRGGLDVTPWVSWFADQFAQACRHSSMVIDRALEKSRFWAEHAGAIVNERQRKVVQRLLDDGDGGFLGGLNAEKYGNMTGASKATATRDLAALVEAGMLWAIGRGKGVRYFVNVPGWMHGHGDLSDPAHDTPDPSRFNLRP